MRKITSLAAIWCCLVSGTGKAQSADPNYRGEYFYNFENSFLTPDGTKEAWCIDGNMSKAMLPAKNGREPWGRSYVVVRGKLGPEGSFGGMGRCKRMLEITEILEVKNMRRE